MKIKWVSQNNPTSAEDALEKSIAKWKFFTYCTGEQLSAKAWRIVSWCGLCEFIQNECKICIFKTDCPSVMETENLAHSVEDGCATLAQFHAAARKVYDKLKDLRK